MSPSHPTPPPPVVPVTHQTQTAKPRYRGGAEIHHRLIEGGCFVSESLDVKYDVTCDELESLQTRLQRRDPTMGLIDPSRLVTCGGDARDVARVTIHGGEELPWNTNTFDVFVYLAHLITENELFAHVFCDESESESDDDEDRKTEGTAGATSPSQVSQVPRNTTVLGSSPNGESSTDAFFADGSFTGTLLWDASLRLAGFVLRSHRFRNLLIGANVVELGCGVGLLGLVAKRCGSAICALTDRESLRTLCEDNIEAWRFVIDKETEDTKMVRRRDTKIENQNDDENLDVQVRPEGSGPQLFFCALEWEDERSVTQLKQRLHHKVDVIFAADCVFGTLFGSSEPLVAVLEKLSQPGTEIVIATERRPDDGLGSFRVAMHENFTREVLEITGPDGSEPGGGGGYSHRIVPVKKVV